MRHSELVVVGTWLCLACACGKTPGGLQPALRGGGVSGAPSAAPAANAQPRTAAPTTPSAPSLLAENAKRGDAVRRDFAAELLSNLGEPSSCLKARPAGAVPNTTDLSVTAYVMPSGGVSRCDAEGSGLDADELACVCRLIAAVHFAQPVDNAPLVVTASVKLQLPNPNGSQVRSPAQLQRPLDPLAPPKRGLPPPHVDQPGNVPTPAPPTFYAPAPGNVPTPAPPTFYAPVPGNVPTPAPPAKMP